jgi:diguanylate cyclase (GGDEF)-like protein
MPNPPEPRTIAALFRMLEPRLNLSAIGLIAQNEAGTTLVGATSSLSRIWPAEAPRAGRPAAGTRINPATLGLPPGFAAIWPLSPPFALVIHDSRPRKLSASLTEALDDAALLLTPVLRPQAVFPLPPEAEPAPAPGGEGCPVRGAILPRAAAHRVIDTALRAARRSGGTAPHLFMIGLDRFRSVNEALGLAAGDALLAVTGARLERALTPGDRLARLEGDRFLVIAAFGTESPDRLATRLLDVIRQPIVLAGRRLSTQASIGIVAPGALPGTGRDAPDLLLRADSAMRRAKDEGRRLAIHEPALDHAALETSQLEIDLANAPAAGQMRLSYQPFIDLETGEIAGAEALMRWRHPTRGEVRPITFIPLAESTGLILPLGHWALRAACRTARSWPADITLAVNISALQFHQRGFLAQVDQVLAETGFPAERLELEVTETVLMRDNPDTLGQLRALIARGIRIALDDFGTGYSALAYLARLPHHRIKLDKSFVGDLANPATADLIRAIIAQARANGVSVTAEGVERPEQIAEARAMGFTHAQGYATGLPEAELVFPPDLDRARG